MGSAFLLAGSSNKDRKRVTVAVAILGEGNHDTPGRYAGCYVIIPHSNVHTRCTRGNCCAHAYLYSSSHIHSEANKHINPYSQATFVVWR